MVPELSSSVGNAATASPASPFETNKASKNRYRNSFRRWIKLIRKLSSGDKTFKAILKGAGHLIFIGRDSIAQDMIQKAESHEINLDGSDDDPTREEMGEGVLNIIAKDSPTEKFKRQV